MSLRIAHGPDMGIEGGAPEQGTTPDLGSTGQAGAGTPSTGGQVSNAQESWLDLTDESGQKKSFRSKDDFLKEFKNMGMLRSDYTRKTQEFARQREDWEKSRAETDKAHKEASARFEKYNQFLKGRPDIYRQLEAAMKKGLSTDDATEVARTYADEKYSELNKKLEELQNWKSERERNEEKRRLYDSFKSRFEDFNEESVEEGLKTLSSSDPEAILELLYHASKGRNPPNPLEMQRKIVEGIEAKKGARVLPGGPSAKPMTDYRSFDEAEEAALRDLTK
jgi:hypothetical protein